MFRAVTVSGISDGSIVRRCSSCSSTPASVFRTSDISIPPGTLYSGSQMQSIPAGSSRIGEPQTGQYRPFVRTAVFPAVQKHRPSASFEVLSVNRKCARSPSGIQLCVQQNSGSTRILPLLSIRPIFPPRVITE